MVAAVDGSAATSALPSGNGMMTGRVFSETFNAPERGLDGMSNLPESLEDKEREEEVGASHGDVTGAWRIVRNGTLLAIVALALAYAIFA